MRRTILTLALALPLVSACASGGMQPRFDRVSGQTNLQQTILKTSGGLTGGRFPMTVNARYSWRGQGAPAPAQFAYLSFSTWPRTDAGWQWRSDNQLRVVVDGEQRATYNGRYSGDTQKDGLYENVTYQIPIGDLVVMSAATRVEGRIGAREFTFDGADLAKLREFVTYIRGGSQP